MAKRVSPATGLVLHPPEGRPYRFDPGALCLDLLTTGGPGPLARFEALYEPADLVAWADRSRLAPGLRFTCDDGEVRAARTMRDALRRLALARAEGGPAAGPDLAVINAAAARAPLVAGIASDGSRRWAPHATGTQVISTVARDAVELFTGPYRHRIRVCEAPDCFLLFADTSRPGRRRWCAMERCGNRHKVRAHRVRRSEGEI